jgi:hypothetical protein
MIIATFYKRQHFHDSRRRDQKNSLVLTSVKLQSDTDETD